MANNVICTLKINGPKEELNTFIKDAKGKEEVFDIDKLLPSPKELDEIAWLTEPLKGLKLAKAIIEYNEDVKKNPKMHRGKPISYHTSRNLIKKYGVTNWRAWAENNWGTKWVAYSELYKEGKTYIKYIFDSAWSPPVEGIINISKKYPKLKFDMRYDEPGMQFKGRLIAQNGYTLLDDSINY